MLPGVHVPVEAGPNRFLLIPMQLEADICDYNVGGARIDETPGNIAHDAEHVSRLEGHEAFSGRYGQAVQTEIPTEV